jgi:hypothetical protein
MSVPQRASLFNIYDVLTSTKDETTGTLTYQLGDAINAEVVSDGAESWSHFGFASRPSEVEPSEEDAPQSISIARSDRDLVIAERDVRGQQIYGNLKAGETCLYAAGKDTTGQARILLKQDGGINLYTKFGNAEGGDGIAILLNAQDDSITLTNSQGVGIRISNDGVQIIGKGGSAGIVVSDKIELSSDTIQVPNLNVLGGLAVGAGGLNVGGPTTLTALTAGVCTTGALTAAHLSGPTTLSGTLPSTGVAVGACTIAVLGGIVTLV